MAKIDAEIAKLNKDEPKEEVKKDDVKEKIKKFKEEKAKAD